MRLLLINTVYGFGSTGRICAEIAKAANQNGDTCMVFCRESKKANNDFTAVYSIGNKLNMLSHAGFSRIFDDQGLHSKIATRILIEKANNYDPDLLWLHNIHGYYLNYELLFKWIKSRPQMMVKWTLHDCWAFTGHCAYFTMAGCDKWKTGCHHCPQLSEYPKSILFDNSCNNYRRKKNAFCGVNNLTIITPSKWLSDLVGQSYLKDYETKVINNTIDTNTFKPVNSSFRSKNGLENARIVLGVANYWGVRKGLDRFIDLANKLPDYFKVVLVGQMTTDQLNSLPNNIMPIGRTNSALELAEIYSSADVFLLLTREDNYPTVALEAEACGTPVITMDVGGCSETIHRNDSFVVSSLDDVFKILINNYPNLNKESL